MTAVSKNVYFHVLDNIVNKYNSTVHRTIKMISTEVTSNSYAKYTEDSSKKDSKFKFAIVLGFQNTKRFLLKDILQIGQKKILLLVKLKTQFLRHMLSVNQYINGEPITGSFYEKELQKTSQKKIQNRKSTQKKRW